MSATVSNSNNTELKNLVSNNILYNYSITFHFVFLIAFISEVFNLSLEFTRHIASDLCLYYL